MKEISGIKVNLVGGNETISTSTDATGQFAFDNLEHRRYQAEAVLPAGRASREVDLVHAWCAQTVFTPK